MKRSIAAAIFLWSALAFAQQTLPAPTPATSKQTPPPGIAIPDADRAELTAGAAALAKAIGELGAVPANAALLPDVEIFHKAVHDALAHDEFFDLKQIGVAKALLAEGMARAKALRDGQSPWTGATGLVVRGYRSRIDGSVQPYGLLVPEDWKPGDKTPRPLYHWLHGRSENLTELAFISARMKKPDDFAPEGAFDAASSTVASATRANSPVRPTVFEAMADVRRRYPIDPESHRGRLGFSMGGASCWHLATHHAGLWAAAIAGRGLCGDADLHEGLCRGKDAAAVVGANALASLQRDRLRGESREHARSSPTRARSIRRCNPPTSWRKRCAARGPETGAAHRSEDRPQIRARDEEGTRPPPGRNYVAKGREPMPPKVRFATYTLRYNQMEWIDDRRAGTALGTRARSTRSWWTKGRSKVKTKNVAAFTIALPVAPAPLDQTQPPRVIVDGQELDRPARCRMSWTAHFRKTAWQMERSSATRAEPALAQKPRPAGADRRRVHGQLHLRAPDREAAERQGRRVGEGAKWSARFRNGARSSAATARVKDDTAVTADDIANSNLVLWGDPVEQCGARENPREAPAAVDRRRSRARQTQPRRRASRTDPHLPKSRSTRSATSCSTAPSPSAMAPRNSNALQTPKLPDWALIDLNTPPDNHVARAGRRRRLFRRALGSEVAQAERGFFSCHPRDPR